MKKLLYTIGDSWTYGYGLDNPETECYPYLLSQKLGCDGLFLGDERRILVFIMVVILNLKGKIMQMDLKVNLFPSGLVKIYLMRGYRT